MIESNGLASNENFEDGDTCCSNTNCCPPQRPVTRIEPKIGRNDSCPCGTGRKFKKCCGSHH
ncbi:MAG: zinc chelation protein SecC [Porticoccaceae bacterium]|nr:zinc chelation protein SecC [Porticoccaceae bacterium]